MLATDRSISPVMGQPVVGPGATPVGPNALYGRTSPPSYQSAAATPAGQAAVAQAEAIIEQMRKDKHGIDFEAAQDRADELNG